MRDGKNGFVVLDREIVANRHSHHLKPGMRYALTVRTMTTMMFVVDEDRKDDNDNDAAG